MPADILGTEILHEHESGERGLQFIRGPIFANVILADEINRTPPKTQDALLEAMQERQVTIGEASWPVPVPFLVLATQNPIEHEGTYPLPEAQVDRFMLKIRVEYPDREEEREILRRITSDDLSSIEAVATPEEILDARAMLPGIRVDERVENYILDLVRATRDAGAIDPELGRWVEYGASPRASIFLGRTARAHAFLEGRPYTVPEDVQAFAMDVLRHRIMLTFEAEAELVTAEQILERILAAVPVP
jgi:MoxR-like ATPase